MTRLASTLWASVALGLTFTSAAFAQTAPDPNDADPNTNPNTGTDRDADVDVDIDAQTTPPPTPPPTPPADVDIDIRTPDPVHTTSTDYVVAPTGMNATVEDDDDYDGPLSGIGIAIAAGGGASGFVEDTARSTVDVGGDWDVRATIGTRSPLAFEGSYIGSVQGIDALGLDNDAVLIGNGVQGALRLNATLDFPVQPFVFAGAAWRHYDLQSDGANLSDVNDSDDVLEIPMGVGIASRWQGLMLDVRGEFRASTMEDLMPELEEDTIELESNNSAAMHRWGAKATVGFEF